jgi:hypothetical protein
MKNISIRIAKPCHEDWETMTPVHQARPDDTVGRDKFCGSCQKNVTDFSAMTDNEILKFISEHTGSLCGQLRGSQLNRVVVNTHLAGKNFHLNTLFAAMMVAGSAAAIHAQTDQVVNRPEVEMNLSIPVPVPAITTTENRTAQHHVLTAVIVDSLTGQVQPFATICIQGTQCATQTDANGKFTLDIPDSSFTDSITFEVNVTGYFREIIVLDSKGIASTTRIEVTLEEIMVKGEMIIREH